MSKLSKSIIGFFIALIILAIIIYLESASFDFNIRVGEYTYTSWLFNYDYGFMRRALPGFLLSEFNISNNYKNVRLISFIFLLLCYFSFFYLFKKSFKVLGFSNKSTYLYFFSLMSFSFFIPQWLFLIGKFDYIVQFLVTLCVILMIGNINKYFISFFILLIIFFSGLSHEATLLIFMPLILSIFYLTYGSKKQLIFLILISLLSIIFTSLLGKIDINHATKIINKYEYYRGFNVYAVRTTVLNTTDNLIFNFYSFVNNRTYIPLLILLALFYPFLIFFKKIINKDNYIYYILSASPLALSFVAFDYYRWVSLFFFNIFILTIYLVISKKIDFSSIKEFLIAYKNKIFIYSLFFLILGPLGDSQLFPKFMKNNAGGVSLDNVPNEILYKMNFSPDTNGQIFQLDKNIKGWYLENDFSTFNNLEIAKSWYEDQARLGSESAKNNLALMLIRGGKFEIDYNRALSLLLSAGSKNNPEALNNLGVIYANGIGVNKDYKKAIYFYKRASDLKSPTAMYNMAISYKKGLNGLDKNMNKARSYFEKSSRLNFTLAVLELKK